MEVLPAATVRSSPSAQISSFNKNLKANSSLAPAVVNDHSLPEIFFNSVPLSQLRPAPLPRMKSELPKPTSMLAMMLVSLTAGLAFLVALALGRHLFRRSRFFGRYFFRSRFFVTAFLATFSFSSLWLFWAWYCWFVSKENAINVSLIEHSLGQINPNLESGLILYTVSVCLRAYRSHQRRLISR